MDGCYFRDRFARFAADVQRVAASPLLGFAWPVDDGRFLILYWHSSGIGVHRLEAGDIPPWLTADGGSHHAVAGDFTREPIGPLESHLLIAGVQRVIAIPSRLATRDVLWVGFDCDQEPSPDQIAALGVLADEVGAVLEAEEPLESKVDRLRRLDIAAELLPALMHVFDIRDVFERVAEISRSILPHDNLSLGIFSAQLDEVTVYAKSGPGMDVRTVALNPYSHAVTRAWDYHILDDLALHPIERHQHQVALGYRSSLRLPIRLGGQLIAGMDFMSREVGKYTRADVAVGQRIAGHVALALSHQRMAEESRKLAALQERAANLQMLDGLLAALTGVLDIREVFTRVSEIASKVLPHDAMGLPIITDDREHVIPMATIGLPGGLPPSIERIPDSVRPMLTEPWDSHIVDDIATQLDPAAAPFVHAGLHSLLRVPIRLDGQMVGMLGFFSKRRAAYSEADALIARRIADHVALVMSHQRLADESRKRAELASRAANLDLLDEFLHSLTDAGGLPELSDRISAAAKKVLAHDAMVIPILLPDGKRIRMYASTAPEKARFPEIMEIPEPLRRSDWEHGLMDDLQSDPIERDYVPAKMGYRSSLRIAIKVDGQLVAGLGFFAFEPALYTPADVAIARRIADRLAIALLRDRGLAASKRADEASARASQLESRVRALTEELDARSGYRRVVGESPSWRQALMQATQVASTETTVLLLGESGTGKEVVARLLHRASTRRDGPFVALNCAALPEQLLEAELFGYERGAFTGAMQSKPGQLEQASGGVLFLDEVGEMSLPAQAKFLRVLQEREFQRLGGTRVLRTDARIVAATNRDLHKAMSLGQFREDLFYRLNVFAIRLPALRERRDDVLPLSEAFLAEFGRAFGRPPSGISREAKQMLMNYHWPGNVRELRNILERAAILCDGGLITGEHLALGPTVVPAVAAAPAPAPVVSSAVPVPPPVMAPPAGENLQSVERAMIQKALEHARFNKSKAAKDLGLSRHQLYVRMRRHGME